MVGFTQLPLALLCRLHCFSAGSPAPHQNQSLLEPVARGAGHLSGKTLHCRGKMVDCREGVACGRSCGQGPWPERTSPEKWGRPDYAGGGGGVGSCVRSGRAHVAPIWPLDEAATETAMPPDAPGSPGVQRPPSGPAHPGLNVREAFPT